MRGLGNGYKIMVDNTEQYKCEICGHLYDKKEFIELTWYDGPRCEQPATFKKENGDIVNCLCGGLVFSDEE